MSKNIFSGGPTLGRGVGDIWDDFTNLVGGGETANAATPMPSGGACQPGQIEFGSPSRCGSQADYDAYVKSQVAQAYGGDEKKATQYLQTTQYGQERNLGCDYPNTLANNAAGQPECFSPARFCDLMISRGGGYKGTVAVAKPKGGYTCFDCSGKEVPCPSGYPGVNAAGSVKSTTPITPQPAPPQQSGVDLVPLLAIGGLLAVGGYLVYRKRQKAKGLTSNPYDFDDEEELPMASSLSGLSALGIWPFDIPKDAECAAGDELDPTGVCVPSTGGLASKICDPGEFFDQNTLSCKKTTPASPCAPGQVQWSENGITKCGSMADYNAYVAKVTGAGGKPSAGKTGGGVVKPVVPGVPVQPEESGVPWGMVALGLLAVGGVLVWRKKHMTSNSYGSY